MKDLYRDIITIYVPEKNIKDIFNGYVVEVNFTSPHFDNMVRKLFHIESVLRGKNGLLYTFYHKDTNFPISDRSFAKLREIDPKLRAIVLGLYDYFNIVVLEGHRSMERQKRLLQAGKTHTMHSKHLFYPSHAVDIAEYRNLDDRGVLYQIAGAFKLLAQDFGIEYRWGGDWDRDGKTTDNTFDDLYHFELI